VLPQRPKVTLMALATLVPVFVPVLVSVEVMLEPPAGKERQQVHKVLK